MAQQEPGERGEQLDYVTPAGTIGRRVRQVRDRRGWSARELAERCASAGMPGLDRSKITNIENERRARVGVDEWLTLAYVLDVAPVHLLVPLAVEELYAFTPTMLTYSGRVRQWVRGHYPAPQTSGRLFFSEVPEREWEPSPEEQRAWEHDEGARELLRRLRDEGYVEVDVEIQGGADDGRL